MRMNVVEIAAVKQQAAKINLEIGIFQSHLHDLEEVDTSLFLSSRQRSDAKIHYKSELQKLFAKRKKLLAKMKLKN